jgi:two-component system, LuxR family, response regulator FixJ
VSPAVQGQQVFVVDDDPAICDSLEALLQSYGMNVRSFGSGSELLGQIDGLADGCFIIDVNMPTMTGLELLAELRKSRPAAPAILMSGGRQPEDRKASLASASSRELYRARLRKLDKLGDDEIESP